MVHSSDCTSKKMESSLPEEIVYADDCDFIKKKLQKTKDKIYENAKKKNEKQKPVSEQRKD